MYESLQLGGLSAVHAAVDDEAIRLQLLVTVCVPCHDGLSAVIHVMTHDMS